MHVGVCRRGVYSGSVMCTVVIMRIRVRIWVFRCFSAATDVSVDYLTSFYNRLDLNYIVVIKREGKGLYIQILKLQHTVRQQGEVE